MHDSAMLARTGQEYNPSMTKDIATIAAFRALLAMAFSVLLPLSCLAEGYRPSGTVATQDIYVFGVPPYSTPQSLFEAYEPVMRYLERKLPGYRFQVEASRDYADFESKLAARRFHFALPNPAQTLLSWESGYHVIAKMTPDDDFRGLIVARSDKAPASVRELAGKTLCFTSPSAVAGTMLPLMFLHDSGLDVKAVRISYVGSHFSALVNAHAGDFAACGSTARFWRTWSRENPDKAKDMKVLWRTPALPHNSVVARDDIPGTIAARVAAVLAGMDQDKELDQSQFRIDQQHFELASDAAYLPMLDFLRRYDEAIGLPSPLRLPKGR
jgi:phosphonate transport system substrate-binding protein